MIQKLILTALSSVALTSIAQARVMSVSRAEPSLNESGANYVASIEACPATFQSLYTKLRKIGADSALIEITPALSVDRCPDRKFESKFNIQLTDDLSTAGLDPKTAHLYFQLQ